LAWTCLTHQPSTSSFFTPSDSHTTY
jgi:hypothetical protein